MSGGGTRVWGDSTATASQVRRSRNYPYPFPRILGGLWVSKNSFGENPAALYHCLIPSFDEAETNINNGLFTKCEPGPYRIFSVYSVDWP